MEVHDGQSEDGRRLRVCSMLQSPSCVLHSFLTECHIILSIFSVCNMSSLFPLPCLLFLVRPSPNSSPLSLLGCSLPLSLFFLSNTPKMLPHHQSLGPSLLLSRMLLLLSPLSPKTDPERERGQEAVAAAASLCVPRKGILRALLERIPSSLSIRGVSCTHTHCTHWRTPPGRRGRRGPGESNYWKGGRETGARSFSSLSLSWLIQQVSKGKAANGLKETRRRCTCV